jgi:hypothetical protein
MRRPVIVDGLSGHVVVIGVDRVIPDRPPPVPLWLVILRCTKKILTVIGPRQLIDRAVGHGLQIN